MFTFSFSTAFAADAKTTAESAINTAAKEIQASLDAAYNSAVARITATTNFTTTIGSVYVNAGSEALLKIAADLYADETFKIELTRQEAIADLDANGAIGGTVISTVALAKGNAFVNTTKATVEEKLASGWDKIAANGNIVLGLGYSTPIILWVWRESRHFGWAFSHSTHLSTIILFFAGSPVSQGWTYLSTPQFAYFSGSFTPL